MWRVTVRVWSVNLTRAVTVRTPLRALIIASNGDLPLDRIRRFPNENTTLRIFRPVTETRNAPLTQPALPSRFSALVTAGDLAASVAVPFRSLGAAVPVLPVALVAALLVPVSFFPPLLTVLLAPALVPPAFVPVALVPPAWVPAPLPAVPFEAVPVPAVALVLAVAPGAATAGVVAAGVVTAGVAAGVAAALGVMVAGAGALGAAAGAAAVVVVGVGVGEVDVVVGVVAVVVAGAVVQPTGVIESSINVTAPFSANARPATVTPLSIEMEV